MTGLEQAFYIMAIVYMTIMFLLMIVGLVLVFAIKAKINAIHDNIEERLSPLVSALRAIDSVKNAAKKALH
jgi:cell division protein FtsL